jgi:caffeoyl-CoA O-methyltransferase
MPTYDEALEGYVRHTFASEDSILETIRHQIPARGMPAITVKPEEGLFLQFLVAASGAQKALEIGTLGGYSGTWIARALPLDGKLITLEMNPAHAKVANEHFAMADLNNKVDVRIGNAHDLLPELEGEGPFDFIFIDAEKDGYLRYLDWSRANLSAGGILAAHNAFRHGAVADLSNEEGEVLRQFNQQLADDQSMISSIFPAGDGMAFALLTK